MRYHQQVEVGLVQLRSTTIATQERRPTIGRPKSPFRHPAATVIKCPKNRQYLNSNNDRVTKVQGCIFRREKPKEKPDIVCWDSPTLSNRGTN